ncbi:MAG: HD domain-containing protein [Planctomycetales bacterium]|nr:HD domain-containing protein [Planctomycetales bacterium]
MPISSGLPPVVIQARQKLQEGRQKLRAQHDSGSPGLQVCFRFTDLIDSIILDLYQSAAQQVGADELEGQFALVAHGGYGRKDLAPFSDVDLMLLHTRDVEETAIQLARNFSQAVVDAGCLLGFSLRTIPQALKLAWTDATVFTSLAESRLVRGSSELFSQFHQDFVLGAKRRGRKLIAAVQDARWQERHKYGETVFLLQPNIKRSRGGLRDIQLVRWIGFARYGESDLERLCQLGHLAQEDYVAIRAGFHYLLRLRNQMHFDANKSQDQLDRALQIRLASWSGYMGDEGILPVEQFMKEYFERTSDVRYSSAHFVASAKWQSPAARSLEHSFGLPIQRDYRIGWRHIWATKMGLVRLRRDPAAVLELMAYSNTYNKPIDHQTWREIRSAMLTREITEIDQLTIQRFWALLSQAGKIASNLKRLHELRVLEQIIPAMTHARCLLQFNEYHKYTVDAHCIRAVECVTELQSDSSLLGIIYRGLKSKAILHLALLIHDLGKGFPEDHSEVGRKIAAETADRLRLSLQDKETLMFLVHQHLLLAHTAFRFDLNNNEAAVKFASVVGSSERLRLLLLLTYADLASVGPDVVNQWKVDLLLQLYYQTDAHFRDDKPGDRFNEEIDARRRTILDQLPSGSDPVWWEEQVRSLPVGYLSRSPASQVISEISRLGQLNNENAMVWGKYSEALEAVEYSIAFKQTGKLVGTFHRITGVLSSSGMQIIAADIHTQPGYVAWDRFLVEDKEFDGAPPPGRIEEVCQKIIKALDPKNTTGPSFPRIWRKTLSKSSETLHTQPTQVRFDNSSSDTHTIITLFAYDRMGLLHDVSKVLFEMQIVLHFAKISTHLDQVVDVFYVSDLEGRKIEESTRLYMIRQRLLQAAKQVS